MRTEIVRMSGDLRREVWGFTLFVNTSATIYFESYSFETRESTRHRKWVSQTHWVRLDRRSNNIDMPQIPADVEQEAKRIFVNDIQGVPISKY